MADQESETRECPFCKEEVQATARRCKHCLADISPMKPAHGGICPFCKEEINPDAIRCRHCKSDLDLSGCECLLQERPSLRLLARRPTTIRVGLTTRRSMSSRARFLEPTSARARSSGCPPEIDFSDFGWGIYHLTDSHDGVCEYAPSSPYGIFDDNDLVPYP